jgi:hypothetical protein
MSKSPGPTCKLRGRLLPIFDAVVDRIDPVVDEHLDQLVPMTPV